jgi:hypothetical protein
MDKQIIEECIEKLCQLGCKAVHRLIRDWEMGKKIPDIEHLSDTQQALVFGELKNIMSVYSTSGSCTI